MKKIYVIRHADKNKETGQLTEEGRKRASLLKEKLGELDIIITSNRPRVIDTAKLLTGKEPTLDERAGFVYSSKEQNEKLSQLAKLHPLNHAGVIFDSPEFKELADTIGDNLISLIKETLSKLPEDGKALIVSQDGVMTAAEMILENKPYQKLESSFLPLQGFVIDENFKMGKM